MARTVVKLSRRYEVPGSPPFDQVELREPTYADIFLEGLGFPQEAQPNGVGGQMIVTLTDTVEAYARRLVMSPDYGAIAGISAIDARRVQGAILGFFWEEVKPEASPTTPTDSSSGSDGTPVASSA